MECDCQEPLNEWTIRRRERREHLDGAARKVKRALELCADFCELELGEHGAELLARARTGNISAIKGMLETVDQWQPAEWSIADAEAVELDLVAVEYLEYGLFSIGAPAMHP